MNIILSIITINYNGFKDTCELIDSIAFNDTMEVIVVDNASKNDEATMIEKRYPQVKVIRSDKNLGFAGGNNLGIKAAKGRYLLFINNDTFLTSDSNINSLIKRLESSDKIGIVCPKIRFAWGQCPIQYAGYTPLSAITMRNHAIGYGEEDKGQYDTAHQTAYAHGAAMMVKRDAIEKVGMMPECYFLYYEEIDWSTMFSRNGYQIWYEPASTIFHKESQATGQNSPLKVYFNTRNRLLFMRRNGKGLIRQLTYLYLIGIVGVRDCLTYLVHGDIKLTKSVLNGIIDFNSNHIKHPITV